MSGSVYIPIPVAAVVEAAEKPSQTYWLDWEKGRIVGRVDKLAAVNQAIHKALATPRFKCLIYDNQYGSEIKETIIAADATNEYIETEIPRLVKDACLADSRILDIYDFSCSFEKERAYIRFKANTIFGELVVEEVI